jgi:hypothetical protein
MKVHYLVLHERKSERFLETAVSASFVRSIASQLVAYCVKEV